LPSSIFNPPTRNADITSRNRTKHLRGRDADEERCVVSWSRWLCVSHRRIPLPSFPLPSFSLEMFKRIRDASHQPWLPLPFRRLHRSHSSRVPERSTRLISARLRVSCRPSPRASRAPLAGARGFKLPGRRMSSKPKSAPFFNEHFSNINIFPSAALPGPKLCRINY